MGNKCTTGSGSKGRGRYEDDHADNQFSLGPRQNTYSRKNNMYTFQDQASSPQFAGAGPATPRTPHNSGYDFSDTLRRSRPPGDSSVAAHPLHIKLMKEHTDVGEPTTPYNSHPDRSPPYHNHNHNHNHGTQGLTTPHMTPLGGITTPGRNSRVNQSAGNVRHIHLGDSPKTPAHQPRTSHAPGSTLEAIELSLALSGPNPKATLQRPPRKSNRVSSQAIVTPTLVVPFSPIKPVETKAAPKRPTVNVTENFQTELQQRAASLIERTDPDGLFKNMCKIGQGATAHLFRAVEISTGKFVAIKKFKVKIGKKGTVEDWDDIFKELDILGRCEHRNVMTYGGSFRQGSKVLAVLGYCIGSLFDLFEKLERGYREDEIRALTFQTLSGLQYLHNSHIVHRDLKCGNIMLTMEGQAVISDFGVSALLEEDETRCHTFVGSPFWIAPEVITAMEDGDYDNAADIWSLGITMIEMADTVPPHFEMNAMSALFHIPEKDAPTLKDDDTKNWSTDFHDYLDHCLQKTPEDRWTCDMLMAHPFVKTAQLQAKEGKVRPVNDIIIAAREGSGGASAPADVVDFSLEGLKRALGGIAGEGEAEAEATAPVDPMDPMAVAAVEAEPAPDADFARAPSDRKVTARAPRDGSRHGGGAGGPAGTGRPPMARPFSRKASLEETDEQTELMRKMRQKSMKNPARSKSKLRKKNPSDTFA